MMDIEKLGINALQKAFEVHEELGDKGLAEVQKNPHGETSLVGDIEAEKAVIDTFKEAKISINIISEEHGEIVLGENPKYFAVLDGLDGTSVYKTARGKGRYGTMLGIFPNLDPKYGDYVFCGVMEHSTNSLFFASKGKGCFVLKGSKKNSIKCSSVKKLDENTRILADIGVDESVNITLINDTFVEKLRDFKIVNVPSSAVGFADLASGKADLVLECTRKGNLEIATAFGLVNEAGGVTVTMDGTSLKGKKYLELGQKDHIPIVSASTIELAKELIEKVR
jgi:myo-inositol-1(or 4)-monophosphatase